MKLTKDRLQNDIRDTMREIVDVKNGKMKADGNQYVTTDVGSSVIDGDKSGIYRDPISSISVLSEKRSARRRNINVKSQFQSHSHRSIISVINPDVPSSIFRGQMEVKHLQQQHSRDSSHSSQFDVPTLQA